MAEDFQSDIEAVSRISAVPRILEVVCQSTGMRFAAVARVTENHWLACSVLDEIDFGLKPGGELKIESTICNEIRQSRQPVIIDHVAQEPEWCNHATPAMYGFQSYISMPIILADGSFFGTLCAIDPLPARIKTPATIGMFRLFAELIAKHLDAAKKLAQVERSNEALQRFASTASHDLREPLRQVSIFTELLTKKHSGDDPESHQYFDFVKAGTSRMGRLLDGLMAYTQLDAMNSTLLQSVDFRDGPQ
jgi:GAF domain-containing protein